MNKLMLQPGLVVASFGRHCLVETSDGTRRICHPRGKKSQAVVGDHVQWLPSQDQGTIEKVNERRNLLYRQDEVRTKAFAANIDQALILIAAEPEFSQRQLARALIACEAAHIEPLIALNKSDLTPAFERAWTRLAAYRERYIDANGLESHYGVIPLCLNESAQVDRAQLMKHLQGKTTLVLGPSGVGKSTLINLLAPHARADTQEISQALNSGKHTTTSTTLFWTDQTRRTALIDSPGFQEFGLHHIEPLQLQQLMPEIRAHLGACKFYNCTHLHEPGCGVREQVISDTKKPLSPHGIYSLRYKIYSELFAELKTAHQAH